MSPLIAVVMLASFLAVALATLGVARLLTAGNEAFERRLLALGPGSEAAARRPELGSRRWAIPLPPALLGLVAAPDQKRKRRQLAIVRTLRHAGYRQESAPIVFHAIQVLVGVGGILIGALLVFVLRPPFVSGLIMLGLWSYAVLALPVAYVRMRAAERMRAISDGLPNALDLMVICLEAGLGLDAAIVRLAGELRRGNPILGGELLTVAREVQAGIPRRDALKQLAERTGVGELVTLAAILAQSDRLGTSVAQALRTQAESMRTRRRQRAEEQAAKAAVKIVFPLVFCIFPALFVVVLGPAVMTVIQMFARMSE
jgi:tight adherence protein C